MTTNTGGFGTMLVFNFVSHKTRQTVSCETKKLIPAYAGGRMTCSQGINTIKHPNNLSKKKIVPLIAMFHVKHDLPSQII